MNVLLIGSTGLVGNLTLKFLLQDLRISKIILLTRNKIDHHDDRIINIVGDLYHMNAEILRSHQVLKIDIAYCAIGTTIKKAESKSAFMKVDLDLVVHMAHLAHELGATNFSVISAQGASATSAFYYSRVKGLMEAEIMKIPFKSITIIRPGLLIGDRLESRPIERAFIKISSIVNPVLCGNLKKYRGVSAKTVAYFLAQSGFESNFGTRFIENLNLLEY